MIRTLAIVVLASALVAGCHRKAHDEGKSQPAAGGEVIPGTISDAMIDLSTSQAQAPLAPRQPVSRTKAPAGPSDAASYAPAAADAVPPAAASPASASPSAAPKAQ